MLGLGIQYNVRRLHGHDVVTLAVTYQNFRKSGTPTTSIRI